LAHKGLKNIDNLADSGKSAIAINSLISEQILRFPHDTLRCKHRDEFYTKRIAKFTSINPTLNINQGKTNRK